MLILLGNFLFSSSVGGAGGPYLGGEGIDSDRLRCYGWKKLDLQCVSFLLGAKERAGATCWEIVQAAKASTPSWEAAVLVICVLTCELCFIFFFPFFPLGFTISS